MSSNSLQDVYTSGTSIVPSNGFREDDICGEHNIEKRAKKFTYKLGQIALTLEASGP